MVFDRPNRVRWETCSPYQSILVSDGAAVAQFERQGDRWQKLQTGFPRAVKGVLDRVAAVRRGRMDELARDYDVSAARRPDGVALVLVPKAADLRRVLGAIELTLRPDLSSAQAILLKEPNGDYTRIVFRNERRNPALPDGTFDPVSPVDLKTLQERAHEGAEGK
jgi:outer membrane lipoprotein carrier protein